MWSVCFVITCIIASTPEWVWFPYPAHTRKLSTYSREAFLCRFRMPPYLTAFRIYYPFLWLSPVVTKLCPGRTELLFSNQKWPAVKQMMELGNNVISQKQYGAVKSSLIFLWRQYPKQTSQKCSEQWQSHLGKCGKPKGTPLKDKPYF